MTELHPAFLKLARLDLLAAEARGAAGAVSSHRDELCRVRGRLRLEVETHRQAKVRNADQLAALEVRVAYIEAEATAAAERFEELNTRAASAGETANRLREYLKRSAAVGGFEA
jgi:hypothetical protein